MGSESVVDLSRLQFAITALYHFLFVPLTIGLSWLLVIMESVYVMTGKEIYKDMTRFWGKLFGINFAMGVATGITLEFQFGTNWAYYSHYVGDIFGIPLALEGLIAFFLESTFIGLFFFGWDRLSKQQHLLITFLVAMGASLSALWILVANAWMQNPVGTYFNYETMRMELKSLAAVFFNPVAQLKFVHTVAAGYVTGSIFVLSISSYYLLKGQDTAFAQRSFAAAAGFGLASILSVIVLGDESGRELNQVQQIKLAAIEAEWETQPPPAAFTVFGFPDQESQTTAWSVKIPYILGLIVTRSVDKEITGLKELIKQQEQRIRRGMVAYEALEKLRNGSIDPSVKAQFDEHVNDLGHGLLLKRYTPEVSNATEQQIKDAAAQSIPRVAPVFWIFRLMVACAFVMLFIFLAAVYFGVKHRGSQPRWLLKLAVVSLPLPWIAAEAGWIISEYGRQPWAIAGILPTAVAVSSHEVEDLYFSLAGFITFYTVLFIIEMYLMLKYARLGPSSLNTGRYYFENRESRPTRTGVEDDHA